MLSIAEYDADIARYRRELRDAFSSLDPENDNLGSIRLKAEFESVDELGRTEQIAIETTISGYCQDALYRIEKGEEDRQEFIDWWLDWGARRHALEIELADAMCRGEISDDAYDPDIFDFEVRVEVLEGLLVEQAN